jgi:hypothetical protein
MKKIYRYRISSLDHDSITCLEIPWGAEVLTVQEQLGELSLWMLVDPDHNKIERKFVVRWTGHPIKESKNGYDVYIATVQHSDGMVYHVFEYSIDL